VVAVAVERAGTRDLMTPDTSPAADCTIDELIAVCIARQVQDGDLLAHGLATPLVAAGYILAQRTHAPNAYFASAIGQGVVHGWAPLGIARAEEFWLGKAVANMSFVGLVADVLPTFAPREFFRPAQVDAAGNFNNIAIGADYAHPRLRLPGSGGIPDVSVHSDGMFMYVPRHSRAVFVKKLDWLSGMGHHPDRKRGSGPRYLISDLGQFDWANGRMRLVSVHSGVTVERVRAKTGFDLGLAPDLSETPPPTREEVRLLREEIDPLGVRRLETLAGTKRRDHLRAILAAEDALDGPN
jgi:acyl CoA:acetate/3-ketoacid CoA transferase beta subunit